MIQHTPPVASDYAIERLEGEISLLETKYLASLEKDAIFSVLKNIRNEIKWASVKIGQLQSQPTIGPSSSNELVSISGNSYQL